MQLSSALLASVMANVYDAGSQLNRLTSQRLHEQLDYKADKTPVTAADLALDQWIHQRWQQCYPGIPVVSEESATVDFFVRKSWEWLWCIDPIDGTRGLLQQSDEYCINVALIHHHSPVLGVIYAPAKKLCFAAMHKQGAFVESDGQREMLIKPAPVPKNTTWLTGHTSYNDWVRRCSADMQIDFLSYFSALKFGYLSQGMAHAYPRLGPTSEWDVAAGQVLLQEVGGAVLDFAGNPLQYNARESLLNPDFIAVSRKEHFDACLHQIESARRTR